MIEELSECSLSKGKIIPFMPNEMSHPYHLDKFIANLRVVRR